MIKIFKSLYRKKSNIKYSSVREMFRKKGIENEHTENLILELEEHEKQLREKSISIARKNGHKKVTSEDIKEAMDEI